MDGTRTRRTRDRARQTWYAGHRQPRFARWLGFGVALATKASSRSLRMIDASDISRERHAELGLRPHFYLSVLGETS